MSTEAKRWTVYAGLTKRKFTTERAARAWANKCLIAGQTSIIEYKYRANACPRRA